MKADSNNASNNNDDVIKPTIRTITAFVTLSHSDFQDQTEYALSSFATLDKKIQSIVHGLKVLERTYQQSGYTVQTLRIATNPFGEWLVDDNDDEDDVSTLHQGRLVALDRLLTERGIFACGLGPARTRAELAHCRQIVATSDKFSCSYMLDGSVSKKGDEGSVTNENDAKVPPRSTATATTAAMQAAQVIYDISSLHPQGLNNFQFCVASKTCRPWIPFFPIAYHKSVTEQDDDDSDNNNNNNNAQQQTSSSETVPDEDTKPSSKDAMNKDSTSSPDASSPPEAAPPMTQSMVHFAIGLENGPLVRRLLQDCRSIANIDTIFRRGMLDAILPIQHIAETFCIVSSCSSTKMDDSAAKVDDRDGDGDNNNNKKKKPLKERLVESLQKMDDAFLEGILETLKPNYPIFVKDYENIDDDVCNDDGDNNNVVDDSNGASSGHTAFRFVGVDTSVNPSLEEEGSVAAAMETLEEIHRFGGPGTIAAAAAITKVLQSLDGIRTTGYCGLMLPVCEDQRLAQLASSSSLRLSIAHLLNISSVCGVGVDTVPIPGKNINDHEMALSSLRSLLLDVVGLAERWDKPLTCRVFPVPGKREGEMADFDDSPHMCNSRIFSLDY